MKKTEISCLKNVVQEVRNAELTQQIKLPDDLPDIGQILASWGQVVVRSKEWQDGQITVNGGMLVWVLYTPEDESKECCMDTWIPFQLKWELPEDVPDGTIHLRCLTRFVDGRTVSPRKIMVRCGAAVFLEAYIPVEHTVYLPFAEDSQVQLLEQTYPMRLFREGGEKTLRLEEELTFPDAVPKPEVLICCRMEPRITEKRVLRDKLALRGNGNLHVLYRSEEGQLHSWDFSVPFSQVVALDQVYTSDPMGEILPVVTNLEAELEDEGYLRLKGAVTVQYLVTDKQQVQLVEDAFSPGQELTVDIHHLELPVMLENRTEELRSEQVISAEANLVADAVFLVDFPRLSWDDTLVSLDFSGSCQVLYYGADSKLHAAISRWDNRQQFPADQNCLLTILPVAEEPQVAVGIGQITVKTEIPVSVTTTTVQKFPMVTAIGSGKPIRPDPNRPALILRRAGEDRLWDIAKRAGARIEDIRRINALEEEPHPEQLLLIPIP